MVSKVSDSKSNLHEPITFECGHLCSKEAFTRVKGDCKFCKGETEQARLESPALFSKSAVYTKSSEKYPCICQICSHQWHVSANNLSNGKGCPKCAQERRTEASKKHTIGDLKKAALAVGRICLENEYLGYQEQHRFKCITQGHEETTTAMAVLLNKSECPRCTGHRGADHIPKIKEIVSRRGGTLISQEHLPKKTRKPAPKYRIKCADDHTFEITFANLSSGQWCPKCKYSIGQEVCRQVFEYILQDKFPSIFPDWLRNTTG